MRKKLLAMLLLIVCVMAQAVTVSAAGSISEADLASLPKPSEGTGIISAFDVTGDKDSGYSLKTTSGEAEFFNMAGDYVIVTYVPETGMIWYTGTGSAIGDEGENVEFDVFTSTANLSEALSKASVVEKGDFFGTYVTQGAYILFLRSGASSLSDVTFAVKALDLVNYVNDPYANTKDFNGETADVHVEVVDKFLANGKVTSAKFRLVYSLPGYDFYGTLKEEHGFQVFVDTLDAGIRCTEGLTTGFTEFTLTDLRNRSYEATLVTDAGNKYYATFTVDFAEDESREKFTGSFDSPNVTIEGLPSSDAKNISSAITLRVVTDIPARLVWNGTDTGTGYVTLNEVSVNDNGIYYFEAYSEVGKMTSGSIRLDCFTPNGAANGESMALSGGDGRLVQTGMEREVSTSNPVLLVFGLITVVAGVACIIYYDIKRGGKKA